MLDPRRRADRTEQHGPRQSHSLGAYGLYMNATSRIGGDGDGVGLLELGPVVVASLPSALFTEDAPDRYTVEAVFTRSPDREERDRIHGNETRAYLSIRGYSTVELRVADHWIQIANTNLEELRDGLAGVIARRLADIGREVRRRHDAEAPVVLDASVLGLQRAAAISALAHSVVFAVNRTEGRSAGQGSATETDSQDGAQVSAWVDEGGSYR